MANFLATAAYEGRDTDLSGMSHTLPKSRVEILLHGQDTRAVSQRIGMRSKS